MIKFNKYNVRNTETKLTAKIFYILDSSISGKKCVTLYAKEFGNDLHKIFSNEYTNETDSNTDLFDAGKVTLFENHPLYGAAKIRAELNKIKTKQNKSKPARKPVPVKIHPANLSTYAHIQEFYSRPDVIVCDPNVTFTIPNRP